MYINMFVQCHKLFTIRHFNLQQGQALCPHSSLTPVRWCSDVRTTVHRHNFVLTTGTFLQIFKLKLKTPYSFPRLTWTSRSSNLMTLRYRYGVQTKTQRWVIQHNRSSLAFYLWVSEEVNLLYIGWFTHANSSSFSTYFYDFSNWCKSADSCWNVNMP